MREYSTPAVAEIPASARLTDTVFARAQDSPGSVVLRRRAAQPGAGQAGWQDVTAAAFRDGVAAHAKGLIAAGIGAGDRVALMSRTRYEWTVADYAIWAAGAVTVPVYETSSAEQVEWILTDSGARAIVVETPAHLAAIADVLRGRPGVTHVWLIDPDPGAATAAEPFAALPAAGAAVTDAELGQRRLSVGAADTATIIYTSGTTGRPKGCVITNANLLAASRNAIRGPMAPVFREPGASTLLFLPLAHSFARIIEVAVMEAGAVLGHTPDIRNLLPDLAGFQPTFLLAVPRVFEKVYNGAEQQAAASRVRNAIFQAAARAAIGGRCDYAVSGGAPLGERLGHFFRGAGITIVEGYGLTETTAPATVNPPDRNKIGTVGPPLPGMTVRIGEDGEILIAGPNVFAGYLNNQAATDDVLTPEGWLRSGDLGELDDEGYLRVTGRKKELIVTAGGKNVSPAVLEDRIRAHPLVSQCLVVGDGRPYVACLITLDPEAVEPWLARHGRPAGTPLSELATDPELLAELQAVVDEANKAVSRAESVRRFRVLTTDFTEPDGHLTPSLKIRRYVVLKEFSDEIDALYA